MLQWPYLYNVSSIHEARCARASLVVVDSIFRFTGGGEIEAPAGDAALFDDILTL